MKEGNLKGARVRLLGMTTKYPTLSGPWVKLGQIAEKRKKYDEAVKDYTNAINANRNNVNAYIALALLQRNLGKFTAAQKAYLDVLAIWKDFPEAHLNLAILYDLYMNRPEYAQKHYEAYEFLTGGKDTNVHKWLVEIRQRTGIQYSFIDVPPKVAAQTASTEAGASK
jgi:tetratricopeptide (TPR) repeat protein